MKSFLGSLLFICVIFSSSAADAATFLYFKSEPGDYIGMGMEQTWTTDDGTFTAYRNFDNGVSITFIGSDWWYLDFAAPNDQQLQPGPYEGATRFPFQSPTGPGLSISGNGRGCNTLTGRFDILEVTYSASGEVERFAADFEQHCEGFGPALFGSIRFNATLGFEPKVYVTANGSHLPIIVNAGDSVEVTISMEAGDKGGTQAEKWLGILGPDSSYWYTRHPYMRYRYWHSSRHTLEKWVHSSNPMMWDRGPIGTFEKKFQWTFDIPGVYLIMFAGDEHLDGKLGTQYVDHVVVTVRSR